MTIIAPFSRIHSLSNATVRYGAASQPENIPKLFRLSENLSITVSLNEYIHCDTSRLQSRYPAIHHLFSVGCIYLLWFFSAMLSPMAVRQLLKLPRLEYCWWKEKKIFLSVVLYAHIDWWLHYWLQRGESLRSTRPSHKPHEENKSRPTLYVDSFPPWTSSLVFSAWEKGGCNARIYLRWKRCVVVVSHHKQI